eukprot:TRINITY_DN30904_c0_g1_i1.p1 TRINITY_DN30904_c0_g1~~TRINITY_DN30904_c0_g1_i1.p1  ORF type:complete len:804 (+),score=152.52 TRINITY_DN30904_c0_g1_i1:202-2613(+)
MVTSPGEWIRDLDFWRCLSAKHKQQYIEVTQAPPMDRSAGFKDIHTVLWRKVKKKKIALAIVLFVKMALNVWSTFIKRPPLYERLPWDEKAALLVNFEDTAIAIIQDGLLKTCWKMDTEVNNATNFIPSHCLPDTTLINVKDIGDGWACNCRRTQYLDWLGFAVALGEQLVMAIALLSTLAGFTLFVVCKSNPILMGRPSWFMDFPRLLAAFSMMKMIRIANPTLLRRLPIALKRNLLNRFGHGFVEFLSHGVNTHFVNFIAVVVALFCITFAVSAIVLMFVELFWVALQPPSMWSKGQFLQFLNTLNRMAAIIDVDELEMDQLFLFRYGGADASWQTEELYKTRTYLHLMLLKLTHGKFVRDRKERFKGWIVLSVMRAADIQKLWLNADEEDADGKRVQREVLMMNKLNDPLYWPPVGSDPVYRAKSIGPHPLEELRKTEASKDLRPMYFMENLRSYRLWLEDGKAKPVHLYDQHGALQPGGPLQCVEPRIEHLRDLIADLRAEGNSAANLELILKLQREIEDLQKIGTRSESLAKKMPSAQHDALTEQQQVFQRFGRVLSHRKADNHGHLDNYLRELARLEAEDTGRPVADLRTEALEVFMMLRRMEVRDIAQLEQGVAALGCEMSLNSARQFATHREQLLLKTQSVVNEVTNFLKLRPTKQEVTETAHQDVHVDMEIKVDKVLKSVERDPTMTTHAKNLQRLHQKLRTRLPRSNSRALSQTAPGSSYSASSISFAGTFSSRGGATPSGKSARNTLSPHSQNETLSELAMVDLPRLQELPSPTPDHHRPLIAGSWESHESA